MPTIIITGAAGFIGSHVARKLIDLKYNVIGIDDFGGGFQRNIDALKTADNFMFFELDLSDPSNFSRIESICEQYKPEYLYHLAASAREGASHFDPIKIHLRNSTAYIPILESFIRNSGKKVILFSSMATYGNQQCPFKEDIDLKPEDPYATEKVLMEQWTKDLCETHDLNYTIIVPHNIFGINQAIEDPFRNLFGIMMNRCMRNEPLYIYGDGLQTRQFSYIEDSIDCYIKCLSDSLNGERINIGGLQEVTILEAVEETIKYFPESKSEIVHVSNRWKEVKHATCDPTRSITLLEYNEKIGWKKGVEVMANWAKSIGPQEWMKDTLSLPNNNKMPKNWVRQKNI